MAFDSPHFLFPFLSSSYPTGPFDIDGSGLAPCVDCPFYFASHFPLELPGVLSLAIFIWRCTLSISISTSIFFPLTHLDTTMRKPHLYTTPCTLQSTIHNPHPCICTVCLSASIFPMNMVSSFSFVHTLIFHCTLSLAPATPTFVYLLSPSLWISLLFIPHRRSGLEFSFTHYLSCTILPYFLGLCLD